MSASDPFFNEPLFIFKIFAGFIVNVSIIFVSGKDSLWCISKAKGRRVSIPTAPVAACAKGNLFPSSSSGV
jgi:hypothetical protein